MSKNYYIEDDILIDLIRKEGDAILEDCYAIWRVPFVRFVEQYYTMSIKNATSLYEEVFSLFYVSIEDGMIVTPLKASLFCYLLREGIHHLKEKTNFPYQEITPIAKSIKKVGKYYESDLLITIVASGNWRAENKISDKFSPAIQILQNQFPKTTLKVEEVYSDAIMVLLKNIKTDKIKSPMSAKLFSYFGKVLSYQYSNIRKKEKRYLYPDNDVIFEGAQMETPKDYLQFLEEEYEMDNRFIYEEDKGVVSLLLKKIGEPCKTLLTNRYINGVRATIIAEEENAKDSTIRKRVFNCLEKLRKLLK